MQYLTALVTATLLVFLISPVLAAALIEVPAGPFIMGDNADPPSAPQRTVSLDTFSIDRYEVTNAEFAEQFPDHTFPPGAENHPATFVSWEEARRFCGRLNKRLPTEAEWEKAARGANGLTYPWGDKKPKTKPHPFHSGIIKRKVGLNKMDVSAYGVHDMAGSVWEWTGDDYKGKKVVRGGLLNLHLDYEYSKTYERNFIVPDKRFIFLGFRCAKPG